MQVRLNTAQWDRALAQLGRGNATKAAVRALNRTGSNAKTAWVRDISKDMGLPQKDVRDAITIKKATPQKPTVVLSATTKRIPLIRFKARATKRNGVTAKLPGGAGRYAKAFIARVMGKNKDGSSGDHLGVFERNTVIRSRKGKKRGSPALGIHQKYGPSVAQSATATSKVAEDRASEMLFKNMEHEIKFLVSQAKQ